MTVRQQTLSQHLNLRVKHIHFDSDLDSDETKRTQEKERSHKLRMEMKNKRIQRNRTTGRSRRCDSTGRIPSSQQHSKLLFLRVKMI